MKKILIVDDQSLNQTLITAYINQYCEQNGDIIEIKTANNGIEAVTMCQDNSFDLIFMDILMPKMNGIDATKQIVSILPNALIIIVSTQGDEENQIQALRNGAKDYFVKPIQPDVFKRRLQLYINMMTNDTSHVSSSKSINPFTNATFCYKTTYLIENEEDLAQLWESMLSIKNSVKTNFLSDLIRFMYQLGQVMLSRKVQPQIIMEENEGYYFFSITNIHILPKAKISQLIESYLNNSKYELASNLLSFQISKEYSQTLIPTAQTASQDEIQEEAAPSVDITYHKDSEVLQKFNFMEEEDITSLELRLNELATQFIWMGSNELNRDDLDQIISTFERTSNILMLTAKLKLWEWRFTI